MNNVLVYCEVEEQKVADVSIELLSKGRKLANELGCKLEAAIIGNGLDQLVNSIKPYGVDVIYKAVDGRLFPYTTLPHTAVFEKILEECKPQIVLVGATSIGRDLAPRIASTLKCGLTADCTDLVIGEYTDAKTKNVYKDLLYQIRPAFGGNIVATIVNPETKPQMATVREGVMKKEIVSNNYISEIVELDVKNILNSVNFAVKIIERHIEPRKVNLSGAQIIVSGGFGIGSPDGFKLLNEFAKVIGAEVGASRAAVDAGFVEHERQVGQTGITVRPKLYIAVGISGAIQHTAGMENSSQIISINIDPEAPINKLADIAIVGDFNSIIPKMIKYYKEQSK
ncbi:MAG: electron transfer flavoprotein subunit alpha/FixB family protein [Candidatus Delongbacteria bacterium]|nr:electron transfer flavoprotein subunit alpha/FixB family protein [Candidatus Delongbacteria bacterium]